MSAYQQQKTLSSVSGTYMSVIEEWSSYGALLHKHKRKLFISLGLLFILSALLLLLNNMMSGSTSNAAELMEYIKHQYLLSQHLNTYNVSACKPVQSKLDKLINQDNQLYELMKLTQDKSLDTNADFKQFLAQSHTGFIDITINVLRVNDNDFNMQYLDIPNNGNNNCIAMFLMFQIALKDIIPVLSIQPDPRYKEYLSYLAAKANRLKYMFMQDYKARLSRFTFDLNLDYTDIENTLDLYKLTFINLYYSL